MFSYDCVAQEVLRRSGVVALKLREIKGRKVVDWRKYSKIGGINTKLCKAD